MRPTVPPRSALRLVASMWFAAVVLVLLLVAMACATVFESINGTEQALAVFYMSRWFQLLLAMLAVSIGAALISRYPYTKRQLGFVLAHVGILLILGGALTTKYFGVDGQVGVAEGQTVDYFGVSEPTLTVLNRATQARSTLNLDRSAFGGIEARNQANSEPLILDNVRVEVLAYIPDSDATQRLANDNPRKVQAIEISLSPTGKTDSVWIFENQSARVGPWTVAFRTVNDPAELEVLISGKQENVTESPGAIKVTLGDRSFDIPLPDALAKPEPLGDTGFTAKVIRYLPHANVGPDGKLANRSNQPVNPAIEVEFSGPSGTEKRLAFSKFPDFASMHGDVTTEELKVTFNAPIRSRIGSSVEVIAGPSGNLYVRFPAKSPSLSGQALAVGSSIESPWPDRQFGILSYRDHARVAKSITPVTPIRKERTPAILVKLTSGEHSSENWIQKYNPLKATVDGQGVEIAFSNRQIPLGFAFKLDKFRVGYYPGERQPRSFESHITIIDPVSGGTHSRLVSMNNPTKYGGYTLYQSSYKIDGDLTISYLSVARDPGALIVFAGYVITVVGMVMGLFIQTANHRRRDAAVAGRLAADLENQSRPLASAPPLQDVADESSRSGDSNKEQDRHPAATPQR